VGEVSALRLPARQGWGGPSAPLGLEFHKGKKEEHNSVFSDLPKK